MYAYRNILALWYTAVGFMANALTGLFFRQAGRSYRRSMLHGRAARQLTLLNFDSSK
jgi:hypothetical protein